MSTIATLGCELRSRFEQQLVGVVVASDDLEPRVAEHALDAVAEQDAVLGDHRTHGISALTRVPPPGRAPYPKPAPECLYPIREPTQARATLACPRRRLPSSVTSTTTPEPVSRSTSTPARRRLRVLSDIGKALRDEVERRHLERLRTAGGSNVHGQTNGHRRMSRELLERDGQTMARRRLPGGGHVRPRGAPRATAAISRLRRLEARSGVRDRCRALSSSRLRSRESAIRRCCAPSCRLRSSLCRSFCPASITLRA